MPTGSQCIVDSEDPAEWARAIKAVRHKERNVRLEEARILRENYLKQFSWEKPCDFLVKKMYNLAFGKLFSSCIRNAEVLIKFEIMAKLTCSALNIQFTSQQLFLNAMGQ